MIQSAHSGDNLLPDLALDLGVFDDLQVLVLSGFFNPGKHGGDSFLLTPPIYILLIANARNFCRVVGTTFSRFFQIQVNIFRGLRLHQLMEL
jgi:hypothetical protein